MARTQIHDEGALFDLLIAVVERARKDAKTDYRARYFLESLGVVVHALTGTTNNENLV